MILHTLDTEIYIGVAIGLSLSILLLILITLVSCERYIESKKIRKLLKILGAPQAFTTNDEDDLHALEKPADTWDGTNYSK